MTALQSTTYAAGDKIITLWAQTGYFSFAVGSSDETRSTTVLGPGEVATNAPRADIGSQLESVSVGYVSGKQLVNVGGVNLLGNVSLARHLWQEIFSGANGVFNSNTLKVGVMPSTLTATIGYKWKVNDATFSQRNTFNIVIGTAFKFFGPAITAGKVIVSSSSFEGYPVASVMHGTLDRQALGIALEDVTSGKFAYASVAGHIPYGFVAGAFSGDLLYVDSAGDLTTTVGSNYLLGKIVSETTSADLVGILKVD